MHFTGSLHKFRLNYLVFFLSQENKTSREQGVVKTPSANMQEKGAILFLCACNILRFTTESS